jgi:hypothetical protein
MCETVPKNQRCECWHRGVWDVYEEFNAILRPIEALTRDMVARNIPVPRDLAAMEGYYNGARRVVERLLGPGEE